MHIDKLEIKGFGKLFDRTVFLKKGVNIIYGNNETGKTTLQWFIKGVLYGLKNTRQTRNEAISAQKRFEPWDGGQYGGALEYTLDDGSSYRAERNFGSGVVKLFDSYFNDITSSFEIARDKTPMFAEQQLRMDETTFERTVLIRQLETRLDYDSTAALASKLANVSDSGYEDISFSKAEKALTEALKNNVGTGRTRVQPLDKLEARLKQLNLELISLQSRQEKGRSVREELQQIQNTCNAAEAEKRFLEHIGLLIDIRKALDSNLKKEAGLREALKNLREFEEALKETKEAEAQTGQKLTKDNRREASKAEDGLRRRTCSIQKRRRAAVVFLTMGLLLSILLGYTAVIKGILRMPQVLLILSLGAASLISISLVVLRKTRMNQDESPELSFTSTERIKAARENEERALVKNICNSASTLCERQINDASDVKQALADMNVKLEELSEKLEQGIAAAGTMECSGAGSFAVQDIHTLIYDNDSADLEEAWRDDKAKVKEVFLKASLQAKYYEGLLVNDLSDSDELQRVEEETVAVKEKIAYLKYKGKALKLAREVLQEAGLEIKRTFTPGFDCRMSAIIAGLTAGRYTDLRGGDSLTLKAVIPETGDIKDVLMLSGAAIDQMYLALRMAMAELLTSKGESLPLFMDEVFSQFDDGRTKAALKYLQNEYEKKQILIFTCKQREVELAYEIYGSSLNLVEL